MIDFISLSEPEKKKAKPPTTELTGAEKRVLDQNRRFRSENYGNSPALREIRDGIGHRGNGAVTYAVSELCRKGYLVKVGRSRFLVPKEEML